MLSAKQQHHFDTYGYLVVEDLVDCGTLAAIRSEYAARVDELYEGWHRAGHVTSAPTGLGFWEKLDQGYANGLDVHQPLNISLPHGELRSDSPMHIGPAVFDLVRHPHILDLVEDLIGPEITANPIQHVRIKPPQKAARGDELRAHVIATDWHQDKRVTLEEADGTDFVTVWVAITDATPENGCLQVAATGPEAELLPHCCRKQVAIVDEHVPRTNILPTPVRAGGAVIFHPLTPHCSRPNVSDGYRWSFDLRYNVTGQPTGRSQFPEIAVRSRSAPETVVTDWRAWKKMWDDTRDRLGAGPYLPQHRGMYQTLTAPDERHWRRYRMTGEPTTVVSGPCSTNHGTAAASYI